MKNTNQFKHDIQLLYTIFSKFAVDANYEHQ